jgi:hypothetical protein
MVETVNRSYLQTSIFAVSADPIDPFYPRSKTLSEQIRRLDKKRPSISPKSRLEAPCVGVETVVTDIVGIADI